MEHKTGDPITRDALVRERYAYPADHQYITEWLSDCRQHGMWMGYGATEEEAIADVERECAEQSIVNGSLIVHKITD